MTRLDFIQKDDVLYFSESSSFKPLPRPNQDSTQTSSQNVQTFRIAVIGPGAVGKSAITLRYVRGRQQRPRSCAERNLPARLTGKFVKDYDPTIEDFYRRIVTVEGRACCLDILDTAGQVWPERSLAPFSSNSSSTPRRGLLCPSSCPICGHKKTPSLPPSSAMPVQRVRETPNSCG